MSFLDRLSRSSIVKTTLTLIVYALYGCVLGASTAPSVLLVLWAFTRFLSGSILAAAMPVPAGLVLFCLFLGLGVFVFFFCGLFLMGCLIRLLSLGVKPGRHETASLPVLLWMILNGIFTMAWRLILPLQRDRAEGVCPPGPTGASGSRVTTLAGLPLARALHLEKGTDRKPRQAV